MKPDDLFTYIGQNPHTRIGTVAINNQFINGYDRSLGIPLISQETATKNGIKARTSKYLPKNPGIWTPYCFAADISWETFAANPEVFTDNYVGVEIPITDYCYDNQEIHFGRVEIGKALIKFYGETMSSIFLRDGKLKIGSPPMNFGIWDNESIKYHFTDGRILYTSGVLCAIRDYYTGVESQFPHFSNQISQLITNTPVSLSYR